MLRRSGLSLAVAARRPAVAAPGLLSSPGLRWASAAAAMTAPPSFSSSPTAPSSSSSSSSPPSSSSSSSSSPSSSLSSAPPSSSTLATATATAAPRLPSKLAAYTPRLSALSARTGVPLPSLLASFLVLHELTALVPLVLLFYAFSALGAGTAFLHWLHSVAKRTTGEEEVEGPFASTAHIVRGWYDEGACRVEKVGRRYGLFGFEKGSTVQGELGREAAGAVADAVAAYVVVKAMLPLRVAVSVGGAPGFARLVFRPLQRLVGRLRVRTPQPASRLKPNPSPNASPSASADAKRPL